MLLGGGLRSPSAFLVIVIVIIKTVITITIIINIITITIIITTIIINIIIIFLSL